MRAVSFPRDVQIGVEGFDGLSINGGVRGVNVSLSARMRARSRNLQRDVGGAGNGIVEAGQCRRGGYVHFVQIYARSVRAVFGELAFLQGGNEFEVGAGVAAAQRASAKRELM